MLGLPPDTGEWQPWFNRVKHHGRSADVRAADYGAWGWRFDSARLHKILSFKPSIMDTKITVEIEDVSKDLILRTHVGKGSLGDVEFTVTNAMDGSPIIAFNGGKTLMIPIRSVVEAAIDFHTENARFFKFQRVKPPIGVEVMAQSKHWIGESNPNGIRIGFLNTDEHGEFISAKWDNCGDTYENDEEFHPDVWWFAEMAE